MDTKTHLIIMHVEVIDMGGSFMDRELEMDVDLVGGVGRPTHNMRRIIAQLPWSRVPRELFNCRGFYVLESFWNF